MKKYLLGGAIAMAPLLALASPTLAATAKQYILSLASYKITVDGKEYKNNELPVLNYDGNTYVPLKSIGSLTGTDVKWNVTTNVVEITSKKAAPPAAPATAKEAAADKYNDLAGFNTVFKVGGRLYQTVQSPALIQSKEDNKLYMKLEEAKINYLLAIASGNYTINHTEERLDALRGQAYSEFIKKKLDVDRDYHTIYEVYKNPASDQESFFIGLTDEGGTNVVKHKNQYYVPLDDLFSSLQFKQKIEVDTDNKLLVIEFTQ
ncbi:stalk domain-containing protein [Paenibacillus xerothermodurans]|uniref:Copper amine oxidase-like N-terminal domain-containing protein n=1 Tax=Paenibacillus xerothermodurans TaxID=1977292 RepID=A0A2W1N7V6_PAEXE|nr:stalk domain-containing protein [Paenibacillus xerothermodurans]PZE20467.1 hypothetical protein CBW46_013625 [Paenibacillus xerothermodurans]